MKKKSIILAALSVILVTVLVIGGTLAYFTDTDGAENTFTVGSVKIALHEANKPSDVGEDEEVNRDEAYQEWLKTQKLIPTTGVGENTISKVVTIENTGDNDAYVWVKVYIPAALDNPDNRSLHVDGDDENWDYAPVINEVAVNPCSPETIEGVDYNVYSYLYQDRLPVTADPDTPSETTPAIHQVYMDSTVKQADGGYLLKDGTTVYAGSWELKIEAYAIQADSFDNVNEAYAAYDGQ